MSLTSMGIAVLLLRTVLAQVSFSPGTPPYLDLALTDTGLKGFIHGFTDGTYGYLVPHENGAGFFGKVARFDLASFSSVTVLDLTLTDPDLKGFYGGFSDGTYGYLVPDHFGVVQSGKVARFDLASFSSVTVLDLTLTDVDLRAFFGGFTQGTYGYLVPLRNGGSPSGKVARFDLASFSTVTALDLTLTDADLQGFVEGFTDGTYGYLLPQNNGVQFGKVARFDLASFDSVAVLDLTVTDGDLKGFHGGFNDGTYGYLAPQENVDGHYAGKVARFDLASFSSVTVLDLTVTDTSLCGFRGGFTDGTFGYVVPNWNNHWAFGKVARFGLASFGSVTVLDFQSTDPALAGFWGGFTDGTYGYLVPFYNGVEHFGRVARFSVVDVTTSTTRTTTTSSTTTSTSTTGTSTTTTSTTTSTTSTMTPGTTTTAASTAQTPTTTASSTTTTSGISTSSFTAPSPGPVTLDLTRTDSELRGFRFGFMDGSHGYILPFNNGVAFGKVARIALSSFATVEVLDLSRTDPELKGFHGGFADGAFGYLVPGYTHWKVARFDFATFQHVEVLDLSLTDKQLRGFTGGFSDGTYGYAVPSHNGVRFGTVARFELSSFAEVSMLDLTQTDAALKGFQGGFMSGDFGYLAPFNNGAYFGKVARIDLTDFRAVKVLDLATTDEGLTGFNGAFTDGTHGYLVPFRNTRFFGKVARFGLENFSSSAVAILDVALLNPELKGFFGGFTDGVFGYLVPCYNGVRISGKLTRFSLSDFRTVEVLDLALSDEGLKGFVGGFTDSAFGYFVPWRNGTAFGTVVRVDIRGTTAPWVALPPAV